MNYFELFNIPVSLRIDTNSLKKKFFELSRKYHPDYFTSGANADQQAESLEKSAMINRAWKTFQDQDTTIQYVLELKGLLEKEEKYELPPDFLMEVMEINEALMDGKGEADHGLIQKVHELENEIYEPVKLVVENYQEGVSSEEELLQVKEYYFKKKYLDRIRKQLTEMH